MDLSTVWIFYRAYAAVSENEDDVELPFARTVRTVIEQLEARQLFSWIGATSGSTVDLSHDYNNPFNWTLLIINDDFSSATLTANTTIYLTGDRTTSGNLNLGYSGNFDLTFASSSTTAHTLTVTGAITGDFGGSANGRTVTIGSQTAPINLDMDGGNFDMNVDAGDTLTLENTLSDGELDKTGAGTLQIGGANSYSGGTLVTGGVLQVLNETGVTTATTPTGLGSTSSTATVDAGATLWLDYQLGASANNVIYANAFSGAGTLKVTAPSTGAPYAGMAILTGNLSGFTGIMDLNPADGSVGKTLLYDSVAGSQPSSSATIVVESGTTLFLSEPLTYHNSVILHGMGDSEDFGALRVEQSAVVAGHVTLASNSSVGAEFGTGAISGSISDGGGGYSLTKMGTAILTLSGANTYSGGTTLAAGQLNINNAAALGTGVFNISGGTIDNTSGGPIALGANIAQIWTGNFTFTGSNELDLGDGVVTLKANIVMTTTAGLLNEEGALTGNYSLTKSGAGNLTLAGASSFTGGDVISGGTESIDNGNGSGTGSGPVTVDSGTILDGTGSITGAVTVDAGATLLPGTSTATGIFSTGSLTLEPGSNFDAAVNGSAAGNGYDQVDVSGTLDVNGANLVLSGSRTSQGNNKLTLIKNSGPAAISGTFSGLSEGAGVSVNNVDYAVTYVGGSGQNFVLTDATPVVATPASASPSTVTGTMASLSVLGASSAGESTLTYTWAAIAAPAGSVAVFSDNDTNTAKNTMVTFDRAGSYTFQVSIDIGAGVPVTSSVIVTVDQTLTGIVVSPANQTLTVSGSQTFNAVALDQFGQSMQSQPTFLWSCTGGTISTSGVYSAPASPANVSILASSGGVTGSTSLTVAASGTAAASPTVITAATTTLSVLGPAVSGTTYTWSVLTKPQGAATPSFSLNGTDGAQSTLATVFDAGSYTFQVAINNGSGITTEAVSVPAVQTLSSLTVSPTTVSLHQNTESQFTASGFDQFDHAMVTAPTLAWALQSGLGSVDGNGLYTAPGSGMAGQNTLTVGSGTVLASANITVTNAAPAVFQPPQANPAVVTGTSTSLSVLGTDDGGETNLIYTWATVGVPPAAVTFTANGDNTAKNTTAVFSAAGTYNFLVTIADAGGLSVTAAVSVQVNQSLTSLVLTPANSQLDQGKQEQISAAGLDQFGNGMAVPSPLNWAVLSSIGTISATGLLTAGTSGGPVTITASSGWVMGSTTINVFNLPPTVAIAPNIAPAAITGTTAELNVLGADDGPESDLTYIWSVIGTPAGPVAFSGNDTNAAKNVTATFSRVGTYQFSVTILDPQGASVSATVTTAVIPALTKIDVTPATPAIDRGATQAFAAVGYDQFGAALSAQPAINWSTDSSAGAIDSTGLFTAAAVGADRAMITASSGNVTDSASIAIRSAAPASVPAVTPTAIPAAIISGGGSSPTPTAPAQLPIQQSTTTDTTTDSSTTSTTNDSQSTQIDSTPTNDIITAPSAGPAAPMANPAPAKAENAPAKVASVEKQSAQQGVPSSAQKAPITAGTAATPDLAVATVPEQIFPFLAPQSVTWTQMDKAKDQITSEKKLKVAAGAATATSVGVSAVYLIWLVRGGSLLSSLLSLFPAWKTMDPLPVLESFENTRKSRRRRKEADKESLESLVDDADKPYGKIEPDPSPPVTKKAA